MPIVHIHPAESHANSEQLQSIYASCLRSLRKYHRIPPVVPPAQHRGR